MSTPRKYVQGRDYFLFGSGVSGLDTTIKLTSMVLPNSGVDITMDMFGDADDAGNRIGYATMEPEQPTREENISFTGITQNGDGTAILTGVTRGLKLIHPYDQDIALRQAHIGGTKLRITNLVQLYMDLANKKNDETIEGAYTFPGTTVAGRPKNAVVSAPTQATELITNQDAINLFSATILPPSITFVSEATSGLVQVPSLTWSHTVSGTNTLLTVAIVTEENKTITSVTFNGDALTQQVTRSRVSGNLRTEIWTRVAPDAGTHNIVVTTSANAYITGGGISFDNVNQSSPIDAASLGADGSSTAPVLSITTLNPNSIVVDVLGTALDPLVASATAPQAIQWDILTAASRQGAGSVKIIAVPGITPDGYTIGTATDWCIQALSVRGINNASSGADEKVKVTAADTTAGYLNQKIVAGSNVIVTVINPGANEQYEIASTGGGLGGGAFQIDQTPDNGTYGLLAGAVNGINTTFTVSLGAYDTGKLQVYRNGLIQKQGAGDEWVETTPGSGIFDFVVAPFAGDIITVVYASVATTPQVGIQWQDEGVNLGAVGNVNEVDVTGAGATASRVGNKVTINVPGGSSYNVLSVSLFDDFLSATKESVQSGALGSPFPIDPTDFGSIGQLNWAGFSLGSGDTIATVSNGGPNHPGVVAVGDASSDAWIQLGFEDGSGNQFDAIGDIMENGNTYTAIITPLSVTAGRIVLFGIGSEAFDGTPDVNFNSISLTFEQASGNYFFKTRGGAATETTNLGAYVISTWYNVQFVISGSDVLCYVGVSGAAPVLVATHSTNVPTPGTSGTAFFYAQGSGGGALIGVDYFGMNYSVTR